MWPLLFGLVIGCVPSGEQPPSPAAPPVQVEPPPAEEPSSEVRDPVSPREQPADDPFAEGLIRTWSLQLAPEDWQTLQDTALDEQYVPATLQIDGEDVGRVGVRYKGSHGTLYRCFDPVTLEGLCDKVSLKIKFDEYVDKKRWRGLKRINLHSLISDPSLLHEKLGYQLFRESGIPAPRSSHGQVVLNGQTLGVFAVTEQIDGRFTADRFKHAPDGYLYKDAWPKTTDPAYYASKLKTHEEDAPSHQRFIDLAGALATSPPQALRGVLEQYLGLDHLTRYMAVDTAIANWDGVTALKCGSDGTAPCANHNFHVYEDVSSARLWLIPWDLDLTFSLSHGIGRSNHGFDDVPAWDEAPGDCAARYPVFGGSSRVIAPGCDPLFAGLATGAGPDFRRALAELLEGPFRLEKVYADVDRWAAHLAPAVQSDPTLDFEHWQWAVEALKRDVEVLHLRAALLRDGQRPVKFKLASGAVNDFEDVTAYGLAAGTELNASAHQRVGRTLNRQAPLTGAADARFDFTFQDGPDTQAWGQWGLFAFELEGAPADLRGRALRIRLASNTQRSVLVELRTRPNAAGKEGALVWKVVVPPGGGDFELHAADAQLPPGAAAEFPTPESVLSQADALVLVPLAVGRGADGRFPEGKRDEGWIQVDDVEFVAR